MNKVKFSLPICALLALSACQPSGSGADKVVLDDETKKVSYAMGVDIGNSLRQFETDVDMDALNRGIQDSLNEGEKLLTDEELQQVMADFSSRLRERKQKEHDAQLQANSAAAKQFLEGNKQQEGVQTTDSGLQYVVIEEGDGEKPDEDDKVRVHYRGTLVDGTEFDSSYSRNQPASFPLNAVIPGWTEGLQLMPVGSKYKFFIPPELAYGERGAGERIGPNQALIFEVELLAIEE